MATKKLTQTVLKELINTIISEGSNASDELKELLPSSDKELVDFAKDVDKFLIKIIEDAEALRTEGAELMSKDILGSAKVGERNRFVLARVGLLQKLRSIVVQAHENLKRES